MLSFVITRLSKNRTKFEFIITTTQNSSMPVNARIEPDIIYYFKPSQHAYPSGLASHLAS